MKKLSCDFDYCIYNEERGCILDSVNINSCGICESCQLVDLSPETLAELKRKALMTD